eukprot:4115271-Amphidinium_carterae.2
MLMLVVPQLVRCMIATTLCGGQTKFVLPATDDLMWDFYDLCLFLHGCFVEVMGLTKGIGRGGWIALLKVRKKSLKQSSYNEDVSDLVAWEKFARDGSSATEFLRCNSDVYTSSSTGKALFSSAMKMLALQKLDKVVESTLRTLGEMAEIPESVLSAILQKPHAEADKVTGADLIRGKRAVQLMYRGLQVRVVASSLKEYITLSARLALRASLAAQDSIVLLPGESCLAGSTHHLQLQIKNGLEGRRFAPPSLLGLGG